MRIPILKFGRLRLTALQSDLTDEIVDSLQSDILQAMSMGEADGIVIDISALDVVDSYMVRLLSETARMVRLLGGEVVICGMQAAVALTLVEMGRTLTGVKTALNLEEGVRIATAALDARGDRV